MRPFALGRIPVLEYIFQAPLTRGYHAVLVRLDRGNLHASRLGLAEDTGVDEGLAEQAWSVTDVVHALGP